MAEINQKGYIPWFGFSFGNSFEDLEDIYRKRIHVHLRHGNDVRSKEVFPADKKL